MIKFHAWSTYNKRYEEKKAFYDSGEPPNEIKAKYSNIEECIILISFTKSEMIHLYNRKLKNILHVNAKQQTNLALSFS